MTAHIERLTGAQAYDLIYSKHLSMLPSMDQETMHRAMHNSTRVWVGFDDDDVLAVWGLIPPTILSDVAYLWLFTTSNLQDHIFMFIRHSQRAMADIIRSFPVVVGHCLNTNAKAIRWLKWLGAEFAEPHDGIISFRIEASRWHKQ